MFSERIALGEAPRMGVNEVPKLADSVRTSAMALVDADVDSDRDARVDDGCVVECAAGDLWKLDADSVVEMLAVAELVPEEEELAVRER